MFLKTARIFWRLILTIGLLGGYTTFSTVSLETLRLLTDRRWAAATVHGLGLMEYRPSEGELARAAVRSPSQ